MNSGELHDLFRSDVVDTAIPYLWSEDEVWSYMSDAYRMFARLSGGFPDTTSAITQVPIVTGVQAADVSPLILKFRDAWLTSTGKHITIVNENDLLRISRADYYNLRSSYNDMTPGPVEYVIIGEDRNRTRGVIKWVKIPTADDTCNFSILRLPLVTITNAGNQEFDDLGEEHHNSLLLWMKHRAYAKQDAETFDRGKSNENKALFEQYCENARLEYEKYKTKVRVVQYGGL